MRSARRWVEAYRLLQRGNRFLNLILLDQGLAQRVVSVRVVRIESDDLLQLLDFLINSVLLEKRHRQVVLCLDGSWPLSDGLLQLAYSFVNIARYQCCS